MIGDGVTAAIISDGGSPVEATRLLGAIKRRLRGSDHQSNWTVVHALGIGANAHACSPFAALAHSSNRAGRVDV